MALIDGAQRNIHIETYVLEADATGSAILKRVITGAKDAVKVGLLIDGFGSFHMARRPLRRLRRAGARWSFFLPIWRLTLLIAAICATIARSPMFDGVACRW